MVKNFAVSFVATLKQRIFWVIFSIVLLSQTVFISELFLQEWTLDEQRKNNLTYLKYYATVVHDKGISILEFPLEYNNLNGPQIWVENIDGDVVSGLPVKGFLRADREKLEKPLEIPPDALVYDSVLEWETGPNSSVELMIIPIHPKEGAFNLCYVYYAGIPLFFYNYFPWGLSALLLIGSVLSLIFAHYLAKPLRLLQKEVLSINKENLAAPLTVRNPTEVADVTHAVNHLKSSLAQHIRGVHELMTNVSHEIRSPLMRLTIATAFIEEGLSAVHKNDEDFENKQALAAKYLSYLKEDLTHMEKIVDNSLLSSKLDLLEKKDFAKLDFSRLCRDILDIHGVLSVDKNMQLVQAIDEGISAYADETLIRQLMLNLLDNAVKYGTVGTAIKVELHREKERIIFSVENTCPLLSEEKLSRLFDPFYRAGKTGGTGVGLGLALVKKIARLHGGDVTAEHNGSALRICATLSPHQLSADYVDDHI